MSRDEPADSTGAVAARPGSSDRLRPVWRWLRQRLSNRTDSEHEQVLVRAGIATACLVYLAVVAQWPDDSGALARACLPLAFGYLAGALLLFAHLLWDPRARPARRYTGMTLDMVTITVALILGEATAAVFYPFYLWITLGMGFRYGRIYLLVSALESLVSFALVVATTAYWREQPALSAGLWMALVLLPAYASSLLAKLTVALERAEEGNRTKSRFLATMSHELRTPLHAIIGMADLLRATPLRGEQVEMVRTVRTAGQTLLAMIADLLDVARAEAGHESGAAAPFDLHAVLATVRRLVHLQAVQKGLRLRLIVDPSVPWQLQGYARSLQQILVNLAGNAIKFTDHGEVRVVVAAEASELDRVTLRIEVRDSGIGIPLEAQERIFEPFAQADQSTTRRHGGTGLGLAIARQLATLMSGQLTVTSTSGAGTCFTLVAPLDLLPIPDRRLDGHVVVVGEGVSADAVAGRLASWGAQVSRAVDLGDAGVIGDRPEQTRCLVLVGAGHDRAGIAARTRRTAADPVDVIWLGGDPGAGEVADFLTVLGIDPDDDRLFNAVHAALAAPDDHVDVPDALVERSWTPRRVLVAEDNRVNQQVIEKMLTFAGHRVTVVGDGEAALDRLDRDDFDVVLMDLNMPVLGGIDAVKLYRFERGGRDLPRFVALTADATEATRRRCEEAGLDAYITKPVEIGRLLHLIDRLARSRPETAERAAPEAAASAPSTNGAPVLDQTHIERLRLLDDQDGFVANIIHTFLEDAEELVDELQQAAVRGDALWFRDRAHALRSSAAHIGARALCDLCLGWRLIAAPDLIREAPQLAGRLREELRLLRTSLQAVLDDAPHDAAPPCPGGSSPGTAGGLSRPPL